MPITQSGPTFVTFDVTKNNVFTHRAQTLNASEAYRAKMQNEIESFFNRTLNVIEKDVNEISASGVTVGSLVASQAQTPCILNLVAMINSTLENYGYAIANCISDTNQNSSTIIRSFYVTIDGIERNINLEPDLLVTAFVGRNIFTQSAPILTYAKNQYNARVKTFDGYLTSIANSFTNTTGSIETLLTTLDSCLLDIETQNASAMTMIQSFLATCTKFSKA